MGIHFERQLIHSCTRERAAESQAADNEIYRDWQNAGTLALDCRYVQERERYTNEAESQEVLTETVLFLSYGADITAQDRVVDIEDEDGNTIEAGPFDIIDVTPKFGKGGHHLELRLEKVD